jgi:hypothetical protein
VTREKRPFWNRGLCDFDMFLGAGEDRYRWAGTRWFESKPLAGDPRTNSLALRKDAIVFEIWSTIGIAWYIVVLAIWCRFGPRVDGEREVILL